MAAYCCKSYFGQKSGYIADSQSRVAYHDSRAQFLKPAEDLELALAWHGLKVSSLSIFRGFRRMRTSDGEMRLEPTSRRKYV